MASIFSSVRNSLSGPQQVSLDARQQSWLHARMSCGRDADCLAAAYTQRIAELTSLQHATQQQTSDNSSAVSPYVVDGLTLGGKVHLDSNAYKQYHCGPSGNFPGFIWCHKERTEQSKRGEITSSNSILHAPDGTAWYINRYIEPAFFGPNDIRKAIDQLSAKFGERPREFRMSHRRELPDALIATWGKVELKQLDAEDVATVASGGTVNGLSISYLGDLQRSAKAGVPVYRLAGGAGFVWAATFNKDGTGALRFLAIDISKIQSSPQIVENPNSAAHPKSAATNASSPTQISPSAAEQSGSISVPLKYDGGTYTVPVLINNAITLDFTVDSGASDVSIPADVVMTLIRTGTINESDFIGKKSYTLADGSTVPSVNFRIRSLKVGNTTLENVVGSVAPPQGSLLLGQSFLSRFRSWSINNSKKVLDLVE
jgi:predicted aspartyl protease